MNDRDNKSRRIYEDLVLQLTEKINSGEIPNGSLLPSERKLTEMFGVSRAAVRGAIVALNTSGLISVRPNRRPVVTQLNHAGFFNQLTSAAQSLMARPNGMADMQEARAVFECGMARHAARHASNKEIEQLRVALERNKEAVKDNELFANTGLAFHKILAEIPHNEIFTACQSAFTEWMRIRRTLSIQGRPTEANMTVYKKREAIFQAIAAHDVDAADRAMSALLGTVNQIYQEALEAIRRNVK